MSSLSTTVTTIKKNKAPRPRTVPQRSTTVRNSANRNSQRAIRRRRRPIQRPTSLIPSNSLESKWLATLNDPFENGPVKLGLGTMIPTITATAYLRTQFTASADGTLAVYMFPHVGTINPPIYYNDGGMASTTWNGIGYTNGATIANEMSECRVIAGGMRAIPLVAATATPGICYSGSVPVSYPGYLPSINPGGAFTSTALIASLATNGATATMRPHDFESFHFYVTSISGPSTSTSSNWSVPCIVFTGLPASTKVMVEFVLHIEGIMGSGNSIANLASDVRATEQSVPTRYETLEAMYNSFRSHLLPPSVASFALDEVRAQAARLSGSVGRGLANAALSYAQRRQNALRNYMRVEALD